MRGQRLEVHEFGQAVGFGLDAGGFVEGTFYLQHFGAVSHHIIRSPVGAQHAVALLDEAFKAAGDVEDGEGDEQTVAGGVNEGGRGLESAAEGGFALRAERILLAADAQNFGADGVTSGVVSAHGGGGVGDANALHGARLISGHGLAFDGGHAAHAQQFARHFGPAAQHLAGGRAFAHLVNELNGALAVAEGDHPAFHRHAQGHAGFNGVQTVSVAQVHHRGDVVQIFHAQIGAQSPGGFVLDAGGAFALIGVEEGVGALDDAAGGTGVVVHLFAGALFVGFKDGFASGLGGAVKASRREVAGGQAARFIKDVHQHSRAVGIQAALGFGDGVAADGVNHLLAAFVKEGLIGDLHTRRALGVEHDEFQPLGSHHRAHTAAPGVAAGALGLVVEDDAGVAVAVFGCVADTGDGNAALEALVDHGVGFVHILAGVFAGVKEFHHRLFGVRIPTDQGSPEFVGILRQTFHNHGANAQAGQIGAPGGAGVGFFDAAGEGRFAADRDTGRGGGRCAGDDARRKDQFVVGAQGVAQRRHFFRHNF